VSYIPRDNLGIIEKLLELDRNNDIEDDNHSESSNSRTSIDGILEENSHQNKIIQDNSHDSANNP